MKNRIKNIRYDIKDHVDTICKFADAMLKKGDLTFLIKGLMHMLLLHLVRFLFPLD